MKLLISNFKMIKEEEIKRTIYRLSELIYEMYLNDLKSGNIVKEPIKYYGKVCKKRNILRNNEEPNLFNCCK